MDRIIIKRSKLDRFELKVYKFVDKTEYFYPTFVFSPLE